MAGWLNAAVRGAMVCALGMGGVSAASAATLLPQSWNGWKWNRTGNLQIKIGDNVSSAYDSYLRAAAAQWSASPVIDFVVVGGSSDPTSCNAVWGTVQACSGNYGATGWLGWAQVWTSGTQIVKATVKFNDFYFANPRYNTVAYRQMVTCHELGHTLGLNHSDWNMGNANIGSCLDYTNDPSGTKGTNGKMANVAPSATDMARLAAIYAKTDLTQLPSTRVTVMGGSAVAVPEPASWATMISGFGLLGAAARRRKIAAATLA